MLLEIDGRLDKAITEMANAEHKSVSQLINDVLIELLEDHHDIQAADKALSEIKSGQSGVISFEEWEKQLDEMEN